MKRQKFKVISQTELKRRKEKNLKDELFWTQYQSLKILINQADDLTNKLFELFQQSEKFLRDYQTELMANHLRAKINKNSRGNNESTKGKAVHIANYTRQ